MALQLSEVDGGKDFIFSYSMQYNFTEKKNPKHFTCDINQQQMHEIEQSWSY